MIRADQTGDRALELARTTGEAMGKRVILAADGPGFLVNRCGRPFSGEGLRLLGERLATRGADRPHLPDGRRLSDGAVRADGPGRRRRRLRGGQVVRRAVLRRAALAAQPDPGAHGRRRPARPQERARLLRVRRRRLLPARRPRAAARRAAATARSSRSSATGRWPTACASAPGRPASSCARAARRSWSSTRARRPPPSVPGGAPLLVLCAASSLAARGEPGAVGFGLLAPLGSLVELTRGPAHAELRRRGGGVVLRQARLPRRMGRGRPRPGARAGSSASS